MLHLASKWFNLVPNETIMSRLRSDFSKFWLRKPKCTEIWSLNPRFVWLDSNVSHFSSNLISCTLYPDTLFPPTLCPPLTSLSTRRWCCRCCSQWRSGQRSLTSYRSTRGQPAVDTGMWTNSCHVCTTEPPENSHLNVNKLPKNLTFFQNIDKIVFFSTKLSIDLTDVNMNYAN